MDLGEIWTGGQTGVDRAAWDAAREAGIAIRGWVPLGRRDEDGAIPTEYGDRQETPTADYPQRTSWNVRDTDATLIICRGTLTGGSAYTRKEAERQRRPVLVVDIEARRPAIAAARILEWLESLPGTRLNIAGPRASADLSLYQDARTLLADVFRRSTFDTVTIGYERPQDAEGIRETHLQAFSSPLEARLVDALRDADGRLSLVATVDDRVIGHVLLTPVILEPPVRVSLAGLGPMAVRPEYQRKGVGSRLIHAGLEECRRAGYSAIVVVGHPDYYPRFGFVPGKTVGLTCEFYVPPDAFMAVELLSGALDGMTGLARYHPAFSRLVAP
jgi:putative acetyltransferase